MAQSVFSAHEPVSVADPHPAKTFWRRLLGRPNGGAAQAQADAALKAHEPVHDEHAADDKAGIIRRVSRRVVPGLPRAQTFKRQQSERRTQLQPVQPSPAERRAVSMDRRLHASQTDLQCQSNPRTSAPDFLLNGSHGGPTDRHSAPPSPVVNEKMASSTGDIRELAGAAVLELMTASGNDLRDLPGSNTVQEPAASPVAPADHPAENAPAADPTAQAESASLSSSQYDQMIHDDLERVWILNLSMHFRDQSKREKFFVTYHQQTLLGPKWRRVTISLDYRDAQENSLEMDLIHTKFQREKNARIYEAIRESLDDIDFYPTVTNLKLQTTDGRLHVHVVEDTNEIIQYPTVRMIRHLRCRRIRERDIVFDSHMSGFVYKVRVDQRVLIKKEIPGPDTVDEFLYEVNALNRLRASHNVIQFYGVIVDDNDEKVKGLLISFADKGALIDIIYDSDHSLPWSTREKWARQIVEGLSEIHEAGFVQGDFTLSNIVIDDQDNAKIIDINRRGCPVGWEPPEATPLIDSSQRISMYIGVKSDLYQLGMVLWALAMQEDDPEAHGRPLQLGSDADVPRWYRTIVRTCLADDPRLRAQALQLLSLFPSPAPGADDWARHNPGPGADDWAQHDPPSASSVDDRYDYFGDGYGGARVLTVQPPNDWSMVNLAAHPYVDAPSGLLPHEPFFFPTRGRSPPSPLPSNPGCDSPRPTPAWSALNYDRARAVASTTEETRSETMTTTTSTDSLRFGQKLDDTAVVTTEPLDGSQVTDGETSEGDETPRREEAGGAQLETPPEPLSREPSSSFGPADGETPPEIVVEEYIEWKPAVPMLGEWLAAGLDDHPRPLSASDTTGITAPEHLNDRCENQTPKTGTPGPPGQTRAPPTGMPWQHSSATDNHAWDEVASGAAPPASPARDGTPELNGIGAVHAYLDYTRAHAKSHGSIEDDFVLTTTTTATTAMTNQNENHK